MEEQVLAILQGVRDDVDFESEEALVDDGILDSYDIAAIAAELNDEFDIEIPVDEIDPETFNSLEEIVELVDSYQ